MTSALPVVGDNVCQEREVFYDGRWIYVGTLDLMGEALKDGRFDTSEFLSMLREDRPAEYAAALALWLGPADTLH